MSDELRRSVRRAVSRTRARAQSHDAAAAAPPPQPPPVEEMREIEPPPPVAEPVSTEPVAERISDMIRPESIATQPANSPLSRLLRRK